MKRSTTPNRKKHSVKLLASAALVLGAAGVAGLGTYGSFTSTTEASTDVSSGTIKLDMTGEPNGYDVALKNMLPGDTVQRAVTLTRGAQSEEFGNVTLASSGKENSILTTGEHGLKIQIDACDVPWTGAAGSALTCAAPTTVLASGSVNRDNVALKDAVVRALNTGKKANLRLQVTLPEAAGDEYQGKQDTIEFSFTATQRAGKNR